MPLSRTCLTMALCRAGKLWIPSVPKWDKNSAQWGVTCVLCSNDPKREPAPSPFRALTPPRISSQCPEGANPTARSRSRVAADCCTFSLGEPEDCVCDCTAEGEGLLLNSTMRELSPHLGFRRSKVQGNSGLAANSTLAGGIGMRPGVWPILKKRAKRRLSAS